MRTCLGADDIRCTFASWTSFLDKPSELSACDCPIECDQSSYSISYSSAEYPTAFYASVLSENPKIQSKFPNKSEITYDDLKKSMVNIKVYFDDLRETVVTHEVKTTVFDLIANIGKTFLTIFILYTSLLNKVFYLCQRQYICYY